MSRRKGEKTELLGAYFAPGDADLIRGVARGRGETNASFIRKSVYRELARLSLLDHEREKALGLTGVDGG